MGGELGEADRLFAEADALLEGVRGSVAARTRLHYAHFNINVGRADAAERGLAELDAHWTPGDDDAVDAARRYLRPLPRLLVRGDCRGVEEDLVDAIDFAHAHPGAGAEVLGFAVEPLALSWTGYVLALAGRMPEARQRLEQAIAFGAAGHPGAALQARNCGLALAGLLLDPPTALAWGRASLDDAFAMGFGRPVAEISYGRACLLNEAPADALAAFERGLHETLAANSYAYQELPFRVALARARLALGDAEAALASAETAVERAEGRGFYAADAYLARGLARLARGDAPEEAAADAREAARLAEAGGTPTRAPVALRIQAECARRQGDANAAPDAAAEADRRADAMRRGAVAR
jgi:tetratricopeptide (TPR) repeat protein